MQGMAPKRTPPSTGTAPSHLLSTLCLPSALGILGRPDGLTLHQPHSRNQTKQICFVLHRSHDREKRPHPSQPTACVDAWNTVE